jgi:gamma-glutamylcyclotransferase (GGCT)/AIG2-like uncharacterized protein YtfP
MLGSLFVYGSFCEGMVHFEKLRPFADQVEAASVVGSVYRMPVGFPVYLKGGQQQIQGRLLRLSKPELAFNLLDEFHGVSQLDPASGIFERVEVDVQLVGATERAFIYSILPARLPRTAKLIESGDWKKSLEENPALPTRLTDKQRNYVRKLGQSSGRDIVPIDLNLYRELLHLDLVVDKGRRLALTTLGQEVFRFLV